MLNSQVNKYLEAVVTFKKKKWKSRFSSVVEGGKNVHCSISALAYAGTSTNFLLSKCKMLLCKVTCSVYLELVFLLLSDNKIYLVSDARGVKTQITYC